MNRKALTLLKSLLILSALCIVAAVIAPIFGTRRGEGQRSTCQPNLKQIALGIKQYIQDYDEKFPLVQSREEGWVDQIRPYVKSMSVFECRNPASEQTYEANAYFYNARCSGKSEASLNYISSTIMLGDGPAFGAMNSNLRALPDGWRTVSNSPAHRHRDGANYAFADGHVKWLKPESVTSEKIKSDIFTFAIE